ncbi:Predicted nucleotidyltransferases [uncultured Flavonifractor sp.]|nr:Predicted nucleotidyltransferases [Flavonifractor plautii]SCJ23909.1 Predicted nucleotidyltransferases [uncultured Flavonifractor sp.]
MKGRVYSQEEIIAVITPILRKYKAEQAILFGSYARREADAQSDIDLLVIGGESFDPTDVFCIADELHRATGKQVDVYELREINAGTDFFHSIFSEGVKIA